MTEKRPQSGEVYEHFKSTPKNKKLYKVLCNARGCASREEPGKQYGLFVCARDCNHEYKGYEVWEETGGIFWLQGMPEIEYVIYTQQYNSEDFPKGTVWLRTLESFTEDARPGIKRFTLVK